MAAWIRPRRHCRRAPTSASHRGSNSSCARRYSPAFQRRKPGSSSASIIQRIPPSVSPAQRDLAEPSPRSRQRGSTRPRADGSRRPPGTSRRLASGCLKVLEGQRTIRDAVIEVSDPPPIRLRAPRVTGRCVAELSEVRDGSENAIDSNPRWLIHSGDRQSGFASAMDFVTISKYSLTVRGKAAILRPGSVVHVPLVVSAGKDRRSRHRSRGFCVFGDQALQCEAS